MQVLGSSPNFISWNFCLVEVCPHEMSSLSISLAALWEAWLEGWVPGERAAGTEAVAVEVGSRGPPHPPSDQGQTLGVSLGRGCWEGCGGLQPGEPVFLHQSPLRALPLAPCKQRGVPRRSPVRRAPLTLALIPGGGPCKQQCSCFVGYQLLPDGVSCEGSRCPAPRASASA